MHPLIHNSKTIQSSPSPSIHHPENVVPEPPLNISDAEWLRYIEGRSTFSFNVTVHKNLQSYPRGRCQWKNIDIIDLGYLCKTNLATHSTVTVFVSKKFDKNKLNSSISLIRLVCVEDQASPGRLGTQLLRITRRIYVHQCIVEGTTPPRPCTSSLLLMLQRPCIHINAKFFYKGRVCDVYHYQV